MKTDSYYFKALGRYGVAPWRVYTILKDKLNLTLSDLEDLERCYRVDTLYKTCYVYSMDDVQDLIYSHQNDIDVKVESVTVWYQMVQSMKKEVKE